MRKIPWRRKRQPTPVFLAGKSHGQRSLVGYCPWSCKESDTTKQQTLAFCTFLCCAEVFCCFFCLFVFSIVPLVYFCFCCYYLWLCVSHSVMSDFCNPMDCSPPGSSVHRILQTTILSGLPFPTPGDLPDPGIEP